MYCPKCEMNGDQIELEEVEVISSPVYPEECVITSFALECPLCAYQTDIENEVGDEDDLMDREFNVNLIDHPELLTV